MPLREFATIPDFGEPSHLRVQALDPNSTHIYHLFVVETAYRDELQQWLHSIAIRADSRPRNARGDRGATTANTFTELTEDPEFESTALPIVTATYALTGQSVEVDRL